MSGPALRSPLTTDRLEQDTAHSLVDGVQRWPVIDGIPFLRVGREELAREAVLHLDRGDSDGALALLLADQDDWWDGPKPEPEALRDLIARRQSLTLREAMDRLAYGRVGHYFAHRWSDPTFLAGLALIEAHWTDPTSAFELACGIGHYLRELDRRSVTTLGGDVVFSKLWLARHFVLGPRPRLLCFDAASPWPISQERFDLVLCHDAFYFLDPKPAILGAMRAAAGDGVVLIGHIHNREAPGFSAGHAMDAEMIADLFPDGVVYDDAELTQALVAARPPCAAPMMSLRHVEAFAVAAGPGLDPRPRSTDGGVAMPCPGTTLRRNPLYKAGANGAVVVWPSERYSQEYGPRATYPHRSEAPLLAVSDDTTTVAARRRELVDLPERW